MVTRAQLYQLAPHARRDIVEAIVQNWDYAVAAGLTTPQRVRPFFANICTETGGLTILDEDMRYTAERMMAVWPERFPTYRSAAPYVGQPQKLANHVYGGRMGNAREPSNDGWNYRGGGLLQATGREEYRKIGFEENPDILRRDPAVAFKSAVDLWRSKNFNALADGNQITNIRKKLNGGSIGMDVMRHFYALAKTVWPDGVDLSEHDTTAKIADKQVIEEVQEKLYELGYTEVGKADGVDGTFTRAAVLAFRDDNGLPQGGIDDQLLDALDTAKPRQTTRSDTQVTNKDVRGAVPEVLSAFYSKILAAIAAIFSFFATIFNAIKDNFADAQAQLEPIQQYFYDVPGWAWCVLIMIVAITIFLLSQQGEKSGVQAYQNGQRR